MKKINKDYNDIPVSLIPAFPELFENNEVHKEANDTHTKRINIIVSGKYDKAHSKCYKKEDIRNKLKELYKNKCAFCESKVEQYHIEHYRPKDGKTFSYYWLAFSWDNLLLACPTCNQNKGEHFDIKGSRATFVNNDANIRNINSLSASYNTLEKPLFVNPEVTNPEPYLVYNKDGSITSNDERFIYTIDKCKLNRDHLRDQRRKIYNDFENKVKDRTLKYRNKPDLLKTHLQELIEDFQKDTLNPISQFNGFRNYAVKNNWFRESLKKILLISSCSVDYK